jgi:Icc-related predicted phosphoesterase
MTAGRCWLVSDLHGREHRYRALIETARAERPSAIFIAGDLLPHRSRLDRAALEGKTVDHAPLDVHVGSVAVRRFIEDRQPLLTLHGHIHESTRLTGSRRDRIGRTHCFSAAHGGPELAIVKFELDDLEGATRELL